MTDLSAFDITKKWPATNSDVIQLYSLATPNGVKISIALEELGLAYEAHKVSFSTEDQLTPEFLSLNPNNKIPAIIDPVGPEGKPLALFESGAILIYLAEKTGKLLPANPTDRIHTLQWLMFQMGGLGPMFGQFGHFYKYAKDNCDHPYPTERYLNESKRILGVLDDRLDGRDYIMGGYTIADIAIFPWIHTLEKFYEAGDLFKLDEMKNIRSYLNRCMERPAAVKGWKVPE